MLGLQDVLVDDINVCYLCKRGVYIKFHYDDNFFRFRWLEGMKEDRQQTDVHYRYAF